MPTFNFGGPDGRTYSVSGPEGSTPEQAFVMLQRHLKSGADREPGRLGRGAGGAGRPRKVGRGSRRPTKKTA
jgi:hypothetical protein